jgi:hypothetical protein
MLGWFMRAALVVVLFLCLGCGDEPWTQGQVVGEYEGVDVTYDGYIHGMKMLCVPDCPDRVMLDRRVSSIKAMFTAHSKNPKMVRRALQGWNLAFVKRRQFLFGREFYGSTNYGARQIMIVMSFECGHPPGMCPGVIDWEVGLAILTALEPHLSGEYAKLEYRKKHGLIHSKDALDEINKRRK